MTRQKRPKPTEFELRILKVLWEGGPATARAVIEELEEREGVEHGYTTVLKMLQLMEKKGMVKVDRSARSHVYKAALQRGRTIRQAVSDFVERTFDGDPAELLVHLVEEAGLEATELADLEARLAALRKSEEGGKR